MNRLSAGLLLLAIYGNSPAAPSAPQVRPQVALVQSLYERFAAEAVLHAPSPRSELIGQPMSVLSRYFDPTLARLWLRDRACAQRRREVCRLDFLPLWDSQDAVGATVSVRQTADKDMVQAVVTYPSTEQRVIRYHLVLTRTGWRIHDMVFDASRQSLRAILSGVTR